MDAKTTRMLCGIAIGVLAAGCASGEREPAAKPNVILFYIDDQEYSEVNDVFEKPDLFWHKWESLSPNLNRLAQGGVILERACVTSSVCSPSRYSLLTGQYAGRCHSPAYKRINLDGDYAEILWNTSLEEDAVTLPSVLQRHGYKTGMVGKWHLGSGQDMNGYYKEGRFVPVTLKGGIRAFDDPAVLAHLKETYPELQSIIRSRGFDFAEAIYWENPMPFNVKGLEHNPEWLTREAVRFINENKDQPFFLYYASTVPHNPWSPLGEMDPRKTPAGYIDVEDPEAIRQERLKIYDRMKAVGIEKWAQLTAYNTLQDDQVGKILDELDRLGLAKNTLVLYYSDNPKLGKGLLYEEGIRVPAAVRWPERIPAGTRSDAVVANIDLFPTILAAAGIAPDPAMALDGENVLPVLTGEKKKPDREFLFLEIASLRGAVSDQFKYIAFMPPPDLEQRLLDLRSLSRYQGALGALKKFDEAAITNHPAYWEQEQVYDLRKDPAEKANLAQNPEFKEEVETLRAATIQWLKTFNRPYGTLLPKEP